MRPKSSIDIEDTRSVTKLGTPLRWQEKVSRSFVVFSPGLYAIAVVVGLQMAPGPWIISAYSGSSVRGRRGKRDVYDDILDRGTKRIFCSRPVEKSPLEGFRTGLPL